MPNLRPRKEVDRLRSLGYLGYAEKPATDRRSGVVAYDEDRSYPGYNLYCSRNQCTAVLIDATGQVIQTWQQAGGRYWSNCELLPNGDLLVPGTGASDEADPVAVDAARFLLRMSWVGRVIWKLPIPAHHDAELTPRGQILTLTRHQRHLPAIDPDRAVVDNSLAILSDQGQVLEEVSLYDLLSRHPDLFRFQKVAPNDAGLIDLFHANTVEWMDDAELEGKHAIYASSNVVVCSRHQDTIAIIDWGAKRLVWTWGQGEVSGPHHPTVLPGGNILVFDNGLGRRWSRVIELDPLARRIVWEYKAAVPTDFYTRASGASQRLGNGNTLITNSGSGQAFEVTPGGQIVWEFLNGRFDARGRRATIVRMKRYERSYVDAILEQHR